MSLFRSRVLRLAFVAAAGFVVACAAIAGIDDYVVGDCKGGLCTSEGGEPADGGVDGPLPSDDSGVPCKGTGPPVDLSCSRKANAASMVTSVWTWKCGTVALASAMRRATVV